MSSTVEVLFQGLVLWWMAAPGPYVVIPDFTASPIPHEAALGIRSSEYAGGNCPAGFTSEEDDLCTLSLIGAKKPGGVSMKFAAASRLAVSRQAGCPIPKLQDAGTPLVLRPEFTPPAGGRNAGWVQFEGGTLTPRSSCGNGDCPRSVKWTSDGQEVTLTLGNLSDRNEPLVIPLPADAVVQVVNNRSTGSHHRRSANDDIDWCLYFLMVTNAAAVDIPCPGKPAIPQCETTPTTSSNGHWETIACSNSQYP